jgi:predicted RNA-binding Zn ribbon-like protein
MTNQRAPVWPLSGRGFVVLAGTDDVFDAPMMERWPVPDWVRVKDGKLIYPAPPWRSEAPRLDRRILAEFLLLVEGADLAERVGSYAAKWGVLGICRHGAVAGHPLLEGAEAGLCAPAGYTAQLLSEPVERWQFWARFIRSLLNTAAAVESGEVGDGEDWKNLPSAPARSFKRLRAGDLAVAREIVAAGTTSLLAAAPLALRLVPDDGRYAIRLGPAVHFSALFCVLAIEVVNQTLGRKLASCSGCGRLFSARHARTGRSRWCPRASCQRAARAEASRQYRKRQERASKRN